MTDIIQQLMTHPKYDQHFNYHWNINFSLTIFLLLCLFTGLFYTQNPVNITVILRETLAIST